MNTTETKTTPVSDAQPIVMLTDQSTRAEILNLAEDEDTALKERHEREVSDLKAKHTAEKEDHKIRQKRLKALAECAKQ